MPRPRGRVSERQKELLTTIAKAELLRPNAAGHVVSEVALADHLVQRKLLLKTRGNTYKLNPTYAGPYWRLAQREQLLYTKVVAPLVAVRTSGVEIGLATTRLLGHVRNSATTLLTNSQTTELEQLAQSFLRKLATFRQAIEGCEPTEEEISAALVLRKLTP